MTLDVISPAFLVLAISLSWNRFACIFSPKSGIALAAAPLTTAATATCLSALALAFVGNTLGPGVLIVAFGLLVGSTIKTLSAASVALSAACLAVYLQCSAIP